MDILNKTTPAQIISTTLPAGKYIVGDPCYSMGDHENWISWLERGRRIGTRETSTDILVATHIEEFEVSSGKATNG